MPYIGNQPAEQFTSFATQEFSTSATTSYTLDHAVTNENEIALFMNNVRQQPGSGKAYTATGTALTLSEATASTDTMYCVFLGRALQTVTPATNSITAAMVSNDLISVKQIIENPRYYLEKYKYIPDELVWNSSIVSDVKNQGRCGSCWAFSTTGAIESNMRINNHTISRLSEQELVDCSFENSGCMGGLMHLAFDYVIEHDGLTSDEVYPYNATRTRCKFNYNTTAEITNKTNKHNCTEEECTCDDCSFDDSECNVSSIHKINGSNIQDYKFMIPRSVVDIKASLKRGPISIAIDASPFEFRFYKSGIIDLLPSNTSRLNHAVLLVGYETNINCSYWIIQNSWGENWGDNGYAKIKIENGDGVLLSQLYGVFPYN